MPCVFLKNLSLGLIDCIHYNWSKKEDIFQAEQLYAKIAEAAGCQVDDVEIHLSNENFKLLSSTGSIKDCPNIHGFVIWFGKEKRDEKVKLKIANALQEYLNKHNVGKGFDLTFMDMPAGSFFNEKDGQAVLVPGGEILPPFSVITKTAGITTGFGRDE
jgi:hypothetical protein